MTLEHTAEKRYRTGQHNIRINAQYYLLCMDKKRRCRSSNCLLLLETLIHRQLR